MMIGWRGTIQVTFIPKLSTERKTFLWKRCSSNLQFTEYVGNACMVDRDTEPNVWTLGNMKTPHTKSLWLKCTKLDSGMASSYRKIIGQRKTRMTKERADLLRQEQGFSACIETIQKERKSLIGQCLNKGLWKFNYGFPSTALCCQFRYLYGFFKEKAPRKKIS